MNYKENLEKYEAEKRLLDSKNLTPKQYVLEVRKIANKYRV